MKILLIEDDPDIAVLVEAWVKDITDEFVHVVTLSEGMREIEKVETKPHIIILDLKLPDSTPLQTLEQVATIRQRAPDAFIVIMSGAVQPIPRGEHKADGFIHKTEANGDTFLVRLADMARALLGKGCLFEKNLCRLEEAASRLRRVNAQP